MADYLVLEEDGTSHLELEESGSDFLLEDGGLTYAKSGAGAVGITSVGASPTPPASFATWKVGAVTVPSSTGSMAVTGLGGTPAAVFFYGTNWLTEDTAVTSAHTGMFRGMVAPEWDDPGTLAAHSAVVIPTGDHHSLVNGTPVVMLDSSGAGGFMYIADVTSLDADGFTLNWSAVTAGGYQLVYLALMDVANVAGFISTADQTFDLGFKAGASLLHGAFGGVGSTSGNDRTQEFYGGGAYPGTFGPSWYGAGVSAFTFPTSASGQYNIGLFSYNPTTVVAQGGHFSGPFLITSDILAYPSGTDFVFAGDSTNGGMVVAWDDEDSATGGLTPGASTGNTVTVSGLPFQPGLVIGYSISDEPSGQGTGSRGAIGFSVATPDFQWTAIADGVSQGAFQSFQRGVSDVVHNSNVHAGTIELTTDGFIVTTEEDDVSPAGWAWHAFGHPEQFPVWIPQSYRRRN